MAELPKLSTGQIVGGAATATGLLALGTAAVIIHRRHKTRKRKKTSHKSSRKRVPRGRVRHGRRTPHTAGKRKDRSHRRIRYTTKGQPYVIGAHGKARFISKKSAHSSYKRKGGRY